MKAMNLTERTRGCALTTLIASMPFLGCGGGVSATSPVTLDAAPVFHGNASIAGTVRLPSAPKSRAVQLTVTSIAGASPSFVGSVGNTSASEIDYRITGIVAGSYWVQMTVDQNGNGTFGDSGDFTGYYDGDGFGTFAPPATSQSGAKPVPVASTDAGDTGINFALAAIP